MRQLVALAGQYNLNEMDDLEGSPCWKSETNSDVGHICEKKLCLHVTAACTEGTHGWTAIVPAPPHERALGKRTSCLSTSTASTVITVRILMQLHQRKPAPIRSRAERSPAHAGPRDQACITVIRNLVSSCNSTHTQLRSMDPHHTTGCTVQEPAINEAVPQNYSSGCLRIRH